MGKRVGDAVGVLVALSGVYAGRNDLLGSARAVVSGAAENPVSSLLIVVGVGIVVWTNRDLARRWLRLGRSNEEWLRQIRLWTHERRKWELVESNADRKSLKIVLRAPVGNQGAPGKPVTIVKDVEGNIVLAMAMKLGDKHRAELEKLSDERLFDLFDDLVIALSARMIDIQIVRDGRIPIQVSVLNAYPSDSEVSEFEFLEYVQGLSGACETVNAIISKAARETRAPGAALATPPTTPAIAESPVMRSDS